MERHTIELSTDELLLIARVVAEPEEFQRFDLQALRNSANAEPAGQWHNSLGSDGRSISMNNASASSLRPLALNR